MRKFISEVLSTIEALVREGAGAFECRLDLASHVEPRKVGGKPALGEACSQEPHAALSRWLERRDLLEKKLGAPDGTEEVLVLIGVERPLEEASVSKKRAR